jgi:hypothetical protein
MKAKNSKILLKQIRSNSSIVSPMSQNTNNNLHFENDISPISHNFSRDETKLLYLKEMTKENIDLLSARGIKSNLKECIRLN